MCERWGGLKVILATPLGAAKIIGRIKNGRVVWGKGILSEEPSNYLITLTMGLFSEVMFDGDATVLLNNPSLVAGSWLNLASAIWFSSLPKRPNLPCCMSLMEHGSHLRESWMRV